MSFDALAWAARCNPGSASQKLVLLGLAENASRLEHEAWPCTQTLVEFSSLDRKTVIGALDALERAGFITDTGRKAGRTKQIKVYRLAVGQEQQSLPLSEPSQKRNSSEIPTKGSQKRDTEPVKEPLPKKDKPSLGADAPQAALTDPVKHMFDAGVRLLGAAGTPEREARSLLGRWRQTYGPEAVICALGAAQREGAIAPIEFMTKALEARNGKQGGGGSVRYRRSIGRELLEQAAARSAAEPEADSWA